MARILLLLLLLWGSCQADIFEECGGNDNKQYIAGSKSCAHYIFCDGENSHEGECEEGDYFSMADQMCAAMEDVDCRIQVTPIMDPSETTTEAATTTTARATTTLSTVAASVASVSSTTVSRPVSTGSPTPAPTGIDTIVASSCPRVDSAQQLVFMTDRKSCSDYYICYHGEPLAMHCAPLLHFNPLTGKCDRAENVRCLASDLSSVRDQCKQHTVDFYPHPSNCNYFYHCRNGYLLVQQCPFFYDWDYEKRSCVARNQAKCYSRRVGSS